MGLLVTCAAGRTKEWSGRADFELPTPRTPSECSTRLSHVPTLFNDLTAIPPNVEYSPWRKHDRISQFIRERQYLHNVSPATVEWYKHSFKWLCSESPTEEELRDAVMRMRDKGLKATGC